MLENDGDAPTAQDLHNVGTVARIIKKINLPDGGVNIFISTIKRFRIRKVLSQREPMVAVVEYLEDQEDDTFEVKALTRALLSEMKEISDNNPLFSEEMRLNMVNIDHPGKIADFITSILNIDRNQQQQVLETLNVRERMEQVLVFIKKEQELLRIQKKIQTEINDRIETQQREYFLKEELKAIKERVKAAGFKLTVTPSAKSFIAREGYDPQFGARPLKRAMQKYVEDPVSEFIIGYRLAEKASGRMAAKTGKEKATKSDNTVTIKVSLSQDKSTTIVDSPQATS